MKRRCISPGAQRLALGVLALGVAALVAAQAPDAARYLKFETM